MITLTTILSWRIFLGAGIDCSGVDYTCMRVNVELGFVYRFSFFNSVGARGLTRIGGHSPKRLCSLNPEFD